MAKKKRKNREEAKGPTRRTVLNDRDFDLENKNKTPGKRKILLVDTIEYQQKVERVFQYLKEGMASNEIYAMMLSEDAELNDNTFMKMLNHAYKLAENSFHQDREYVFQLHMERYEKMYFKSMQQLDSWGRPLDHKTNPQHWPVMVAHYANAMKVLKQKEDLMGIHDKNIVLEFNDNKAIVLEQESDQGLHGEVPGHKLDNLTLEEKVELLQYIRESRTVPIEGIQRVVIKQLKIEINPLTGDRTQTMVTKNIDNVQDIEFEEMPDEVVSKMPLPEKDEDDDEMPLVPIVVDETKKVPSKTLEDIEASMREKLIDKFRKKIKQR